MALSAEQTRRPFVSGVVLTQSIRQNYIFCFTFDTRSLLHHLLILLLLEHDELPEVCPRPGHHTPILQPRHLPQPQHLQPGGGSGGRQYRRHLEEKEQVQEQVQEQEQV